MKINNNNFKSIFGGFLIILFFILITYFMQIHSSHIEENLNKGLFGIFLYIFITTIATVIAPISAIPLLPVAVLLWGWKSAAFYSVLGWTIGSIIAFILARKYGVSIVKKFVSMDKISKYEKLIPKKDLFVGIILIRMVLPVDVLSYLLGLFSKVDLKTYSVATFLGVIPFAIILSYIGSLSILSQLFLFLFGGLGFLLLYYKINNKLKNKLK